MPRQAKASKHTIIMNLSNQLKPQNALKVFRGKQRDRAAMIQFAEEAIVMLNNAIRAECAAARRKNTKVFNPACKAGIQTMCDNMYAQNKDTLTRAEENIKKAKTMIDNETANILMAGVLQEKIKNISQLSNF